MFLTNGRRAVAGPAPNTSADFGHWRQLLHLDEPNIYYGCVSTGVRFRLLRTTIRTTNLSHLQKEAAAVTEEIYLFGMPNLSLIPASLDRLSASSSAEVRALRTRRPLAGGDSHRQVQCQGQRTGGKYVTGVRPGTSAAPGDL
ncbi:hypothetical protein Bbelb_175730 [Branchiostoma belcheri]|nr:hypothetical protein Bbelb_175730 [Branchiostoma belcheri]